MELAPELKPYAERYDAMVDTVNTTMDDLRINGHDDITLSIPRKDLAACLLSLGEAYQLVGSSVAALLAFKGEIQKHGEHEGAQDALERVEQGLPEGLTKLDNILAAVAALLSSTETVPDSVPTDWLFSAES